MPKTTPSQVASAIEIMFGAAYNDLAETAPNQTKQIEVRALLTLLDDLPTDLLTLSFTDNLEFVRCQAALATVLPIWGLGETRTINVLGKNPVERIRRLLMVCPDELPPPEPELTFIADEDIRIDIEAKLHTAWVNFKAGEWLGATAFAGIALEAILLWEVKRAHGPKAEKLKELLPRSRSMNGGWTPSSRKHQTLSQLVSRPLTKPTWRETDGISSIRER